MAAFVIRIFQAMAREGWRGRAVAAFLRFLLKIVRPRAKMMDSNIRLVRPDLDTTQRREIARGVYDNLAWTVAELLALQRNTRQALSWVTNVTGIEYLDETLANGRGAILLTGHFGNWELLGSWYAQTIRARGRMPYVIYQEIHDRGVSRIVNEYRERGGMIALSKDASTLEMARLLHDGAYIGILPDVAWWSGITLPFMGRPCRNSVGPAALAMLAGVPILPLAIYRDAPFRHTVRFLPPFRVPTEGKRDERIERGTLAINKALEELIAPRPELWFWLHNRWKGNS